MTQKKQMLWRRLKKLLNITFLFFTTIHFSYSTSYTWNGGTGDWSVSTNWTPNGVPGVGDDVIISASSAAVTLDAVTTVQSLVIDGSNSTLSLDFDLTVSGDLSLQQNSATINGNGNLSVGGNLIWDGGTIAGAGTFSLTGTYSSGSSGNTLDGRSLTLSSGGTFTNTNLDLDNNAILTIPSGQTFTMDITGAGLKEIKGDGTGTVINDGTIAVTGTGSPRFREASLTNNGAITLNAGGLSFSAGTHIHDGATITIASGNILKFEGGTSTFQNTTAISGDGSVYINSSLATLNLNSSSTISNYVDFAQGILIINTANTFPSMDITTGGDLTLNANLTITNDMSLASSTSIIDGDSDLSIGGDFTWTSGTISGSGNVTVTGSLNGTSVGTLETKVLTLNAGGTLTNHSFTLKDNAKIIIPSGQTLTIDNSSSRSFTGSSGNFGTIENNGTIEKNGTGLLSVLYNTLDNNGTLNINSGTFYFSTASNSTHDNGTVAVASGATFRFSSNGTHEFSNTAISGAGLFNVQATATVNINAGCTFSLAFETSGGTTTFNVAATMPSLYMNDSGDILLNANLTITGNAEINGTNVDINGSGDLTINGTLTWGKGKISGSGNFTLLGVFIGIGTNAGSLDTRSIILTAGATWTNFQLALLNGASITVPLGQTLTIDNFGSGTTAGSSGAIINNGTIIKNGTGQYTIQQTTLDNNGTITINAGKLRLGTSANSTHDGATITIASGAELRIDGGSTTHSFDNTDISGDGTFNLTTISGSVNINAGSTISTNIYAGSGGTATLTLNVAATIPSLEIVTSAVVLNANLTVTGNVDITASSSIVISGPGNLDIGGDLDWGGGTISGAGTLAISGTMTADGSSTTLDARLLSLPSGGYISNGTFNIQNGASLTVPLGQTLTLHRTGGTGSVRTGSIIINGTVEKTGAGTYNFDGMDVDNNGTITVTEGKLSFDDSPGFCTSDHQNATINIASGSELIFDGTNVGNSGIHDFASTTINGPGTFKVSSFAVVNWNTGTTVSNLPVDLSFGILNTNINLTIASLSLTGASSGLGGTFTTLDITGDLIWSIASIASTNPSTITVGGVTTVTGSGTTLSNATLTMNGGGTWTQTNCTVQDNAEFIVPSGQTITITNTATRTLTNGSGGGGTLTNNGTLIKSGSAIFNIDTPYATASGSTTDIQAGTLDLNDTFDNGGTVKGTGTLNLSGATVNDYGTFAPGSSPGTLTITGDYTNETLDIEIVDGMPVEFDELIVSGAVTLGGTLNLTEMGNVPAGTYNIISGSSVSGSFATLNLPACYFIEVIGGNVNLIKGVAKVWDGSTGTWSTASSWLPNGVPCEYDDVIINSGVCEINVPPEMSSLAVNGGTMALLTPVVYSIDAPAVIAVGATVQIDDGELIFIDDLENNGTFAGHGILNILGATIIGGYGIFAPGSSAGTLTVKGTHTNEEIQMEIGGTGGGVVKDLLEVTQTIELGGLFELGYLGGTVPAGTYEMMACSGGPNCVTGTFATVVFPPECQGGCSLEISPAGTEVNLVTTGDIQFTGECTWLGGNGPWDDQTNWSCNDVPNADDDVVIAAGQVSLNAPVSMKTCALNGGEIAGNGNFTVAELLTWTGGTLGANGNHDIASLNISGSCFLSEGTVILNGSGTWENANLQLSNGSLFKIGAGETLTLNLTTNRQIDGGAGGGTFQNGGGTFVKTGGGDLSVNIPFVSSGNTNLLDGVLNLNDIFNNLGGILQGVAFLDVVDATVEDFGTVSPGTSPGNLTVLGNWTNNILRYEIEESGSMVNHDLLHVTQDGTFAGTLEILHLGGTVPYGDYPIVTCGGTCSGTFSNIIYPPFCAGECSVVYSGMDAVLHYEFVLPVELLRFGGYWENGTVQLEWETASETGHEGFYVERSDDGKGWKGLGFVAGTGSATAGSKYIFGDSGPLAGENYYRLRIRALDGQDEYSNVILIDTPDNDWYIYPNPVADELILTLPENISGRLQLSDWTGRVLMKQEVYGEPVIKMDLTRLPAGTYCLRLNNGEGRVILKQ